MAGTACAKDSKAIASPTATAAFWTPTSKTTWNVGIRTNQSGSSGVEDVVNLETWSTDAVGGFTRYGLSSRDNASTDLDLGYEHKYGERQTLQAFARWSQRQGVSHDSLWQDLPSAALDSAYLSNANLNDGGNWNATVQADYEKPLDHDGKLELGYKTILRERSRLRSKHRAPLPPPKRIDPPPQSAYPLPLD